MEQQANSIFEVDEICPANLPERLAGAGLTCEVGGIIAKRLWLFPLGSCKRGEMKLHLESGNLLAVDSGWDSLYYSLSHCGTFSVG